MRVRTIAILALMTPMTMLAGQASPSHGSDVSIGIRFGTLGIGPEISKLVTSHVGLRAGINFFSEDHTFNQSNANVDASLKLKAFTGLVDLYPGARGSMHFTVGVITNPITVTGTGTPSGNITINDHSYTPQQVGTLTVTGEWPSASPYVGWGFGTPAASHGALKFVFDLGVAIAKPNLTLTSSNQGSNSTLQADFAAQTQTIRNQIPIYPVINFGLVYRF
jgi:hypothetical protein